MASFRFRTGFDPLSSSSSLLLVRFMRSISWNSCTRIFCGTICKRNSRFLLLFTSCDRCSYLRVSPLCFEHDAEYASRAKCWTNSSVHFVIRKRTSLVIRPVSIELFMMVRTRLSGRNVSALGLRFCCNLLASTILCSKYYITNLYQLYALLNSFYLFGGKCKAALCFACWK